MRIPNGLDTFHGDHGPFRESVAIRACSIQHRLPLGIPQRMRTVPLQDLRASAKSFRIHFEISFRHSMPP